MKLYGIANCDTVRKARKFLESEGIDFEFVNTKKTPLDPEVVEAWVKADGLEIVINTKSRTWKQLTDHERTQIQQGEYLTVYENPSLLKRPVLEDNGSRYYGFDAIKALFV